MNNDGEAKKRLHRTPVTVDSACLIDDRADAQSTEEGEP